MGRAKLKMELIGDEKNRCKTFTKRCKGLTKKAYELNTLCSVDVCLIVYGAKLHEHHPSSHQEEIWPPNCDEVQALIHSYWKQSPEDRKRRTSDLSNFLEDRNKKAQKNLMNLRKKNEEAKYPTWNYMYNDFSEEQLRQFAAILESKLQEVKARLAAVGGSAAAAAVANNQADLLQHYFDDMETTHRHSMYDLQLQAAAAPARKGILLHQHQANSTMNPMNDNHNQYMNMSSTSHQYPLPLLGGESNSSNIPTEMPLVCYDPAGTMGRGGYYSFGMAAGAMVPSVQVPMIAGVPPQVSAPHEMNNYYEVGEFHMKNEN